MVLACVRVWVQRLIVPRCDMFTSLKHTTCHTASQLVYDLVGIETQAIRKCSIRFGNISHRAVNSRVRRSRPILTCKIYMFQFEEVWNTVWWSSSEVWFRRDLSWPTVSNTCKNHASENTIFLRAWGWTVGGVSETEKTQTRKTILAHLQHISSSTRTDE